jgi:hypothetical protein
VLIRNVLDFPKAVSRPEQSCILLRNAVPHDWEAVISELGKDTGSGLGPFVPFLTLSRQTGYSVRLDD